MIVSLIAALAATAQPSDVKSNDAQPVCQTPKAVQAGDTSYKPDGSAKLQRLDQLPPANEILTELRTTGRCSSPVIVRYGIGQRGR